MDRTANVTRANANVTSAGQVINAISFRVTRDVPITDNVGTVHACVPEDGTANIAHFVSSAASLKPKNLKR